MLRTAAIKGLSVRNDIIDDDDDDEDDEEDDDDNDGFTSTTLVVEGKAVRLAMTGVAEKREMWPIYLTTTIWLFCRGVKRSRRQVLTHRSRITRSFWCVDLLQLTSSTVAVA